MKSLYVGLDPTKWVECKLPLLMEQCVIKQKASLWGTTRFHTCASAVPFVCK